MVGLGTAGGANAVLRGAHRHRPGPHGARSLPTPIEVHYAVVFP